MGEVFTPPPSPAQPVPPAGRHARAVEIRQQVSELVGIMADAASGQQALFASPGAARRRSPPAETARTLHCLIAELAALAAAATATERVTIHQAPGGATQTSPCSTKLAPEDDTFSPPHHPSGTGVFRQF